MIIKDLIFLIYKIFSDRFYFLNDFLSKIKIKFLTIIEFKIDYKNINIII